MDLIDKEMQTVQSHDIYKLVLHVIGTRTSGIQEWHLREEHG